MSTLMERLGYHYFPDDRHYRQVDLEAWLPRLSSLGARWLTLQGTLEKAIPEAFIRGLVEAGIEPIVHIASPMRRLDRTELAPLLSSYAAWGVRSVVLFDRPNQRAQWPAPEWSRTGLVDRFLDTMLPVLQSQQDAGLGPILPPLEPGGDYWDTAFLAGILEGLRRRGQDRLLEGLTLAVYAWTYGRSLDWGSGGPKAWPEAKPYHTPPGCQDQRGLRAFEWYAAIAAESSVPDLRLLVIAGGALRPDEAGSLGSDKHAEDNLAIARALQNGQIPACIRNFAFYPLATEPGHPDAGSAWFEPPDAPRPVVEAMHRLVASPAAHSPSQPRPVPHYIWLNLDPAQLESIGLAAVLDLVGDPAAVIGCSPDTALLAERVTIVGNSHPLPEGFEHKLHASGCGVRRLGDPQDMHTRVVFSAPVDAR